LAVASAFLFANCTARAGAPTPRIDPNLITAEEIASRQVQTLYDAIRALRPAWMMRGRPTTLMPQNEGELIVKVKEPLADERKRLRRGQILFTYLHLAPAPELTDRLLEAVQRAI